MKKIASIIILILSLAIIINLVTSIYTLWKKQDLLSHAKKELSEEKKQYEDLQKKLSKVKSIDFIEAEARNKLFLTKQNESEILMGDEIKKATPSARKNEDPNWKQWFMFFFGAR